MTATIPIALMGVFLGSISLIANESYRLWRSGLWGSGWSGLSETSD